MANNVPLVTGELRLEVKEAPSLGEDSVRHSGVSRLGGLDWHLEVRARKLPAGTLGLSVTMCCNSSDRKRRAFSRIWSCEAAVTFRLLAKIGEDYVKPAGRLNFTGGTPSGWIIKGFVGDWPAFCQSNAAYLAGNCAVFKASVQIFALHGVRYRPGRDFLAPNHTADSILRVISPEGRETDFHVSKASLALHSEYFDSLFYGSFKEKAEDVVTIKDIDPDVFHNLLQLLYGGDGGLSEESVESLTSLAHRLSLHPVLGQCEAFLAHSVYHIHNTRLLCLGDQFQLWRLQDVVLWRIPEQQLKEFIGTSAFESLSDKSKVGILEKLCNVLTAASS